MKRLILAIAVLTTNVDASRHQPAAIEKVAVTVKPLLCAGLCPAFDLVVSEDGHLERHVESLGRPVRRSRISAQQYSAFTQALVPARAADKAMMPCAATDSREYDLQWSGTAAAFHSRFCSGDGLAVEAVKRALRILRVDVSDGYLLDEMDGPRS
ncbi:MAG: hypothetical protein V4475_04600 [Pseudomonadota bacterium]